MRYNKNVVHTAEYEVEKFGLSVCKNMISEVINDLSNDHEAESNINQIIFYAQVLHYLKYKYNEKESS
jgi:hypothetical protein